MMCFHFIWAQVDGGDDDDVENDDNDDYDDYVNDDDVEVKAGDDEGRI